MIQSAATWRLDRQNALLECGPLRGIAVCDPPGIGFFPESWNGKAIHQASVLTTGGPTDQPECLKPAEAYIRGGDVVVTYERIAPHNIFWQTYWRAALAPAPSAVRVELVLSVQTDLLDSTPAFPIGSGVGEAELLHTSDLAVGGFLPVAPAVHMPALKRTDSPIHLFAFRMKGLGLTYAEMVHPSDFVWAQPTVNLGQNYHVTSGLFPERLEKGVIRRARICGWFMPAEDDLAVAVELARQFVDEPLPLTT